MSAQKKFLISLLFVCVMGAVMFFTEIMAEGEAGIIVKLELATNLEEIERMVSKFDDEHLKWLKINTMFDFLFIVTYTRLFFFAAKGLLERFSIQSNAWLILMAAGTPGILDVMENTFIFYFLNRDFSTLYFDIYYWSVHVKWALVAVFAIASAVQLWWMIYEKGKSPSSG